VEKWKKSSKKNLKENGQGERNHLRAPREPKGCYNRQERGGFKGGEAKSV